MPWTDLPLTTPSFITQSTHTALLTHFRRLPRHNTSLSLLDSEGGEGNDEFFNWYFGTIAPLQPTNFSFPPPLHRVIEECLLFYVDVLYPYFERIGHGLCDADDHHDPRVFSFLPMISVLGEVDPVYSPEMVVASRWKAGLLRMGQVRLIETVLRGCLESINLMIKVENRGELSDTEFEVVRLREIARVCHRTKETIVRFFGSERFRSERLELLIGRYLEEEGVNWEVVRGVDVAQREAEARDKTMAFRLSVESWFE